MYCGAGAVGGQTYGVAPGQDCADCVRTVTTYKDVQVPCTRNVYKQHHYKEPKTVPYTDYRNVTKYRTIVKPVPKTIYVNVREQVPYSVKEPFTNYRSILVDKSRTVCNQETKMVTKRIPVVNVVPTPPQPCPPTAPDYQTGLIGGDVVPRGATRVRPDYKNPGWTEIAKDVNNDGILQANEKRYIPTAQAFTGFQGGVDANNDHVIQPNEAVNISNYHGGEVIQPRPYGNAGAY